MSESTVSPGKVISITFILRNEQDEILEYRGDHSVAYVHGGVSELLPKIEQALDGCRVGDHVNVTVPPEEGFGEHDPNLTYTDDLENVPPEARRVGAEVEMHNESGERRTFYVTRIEDGKLTVDCNHPLAGSTLRFGVTVVGIRDATPQEMRTGVAADAEIPTLQ